MDAGLLGNIGKSTVAIVVVKNIDVAGQAARAAHCRNALPLAKAHFIELKGDVGIQLDEVAYE